MSKPTIAVIFGSRSAEHDVSVITALNAVIKPLELTNKYTVVPVYIAKDGSWYSDDSLKKITTYTSNLSDKIAKLKPVSLQFDGGLTLVQTGLKIRRQKIDMVFPATHGTYGEDGALMGLLEMANVPYVGCDVASSALAMDKILAKEVATAHGIATPKMQYCTAEAFKRDSDAFIATVSGELAYPLFVKPAHLGSSIAITRATNETELRNAIEVAAQYDNKILVEEAVNNLIEVTLPIMGNDELTVGQTEEPNQGDEFFDFETKYLKQGKGKSGVKSASTDGAQGYSHIPARIDDELQAVCISTGQAVYRALGCCGLARVDMLIDSQTRQVYFNEVNPLPGSLYAHNWRLSGVSNVELVERLIELAKQRYVAKQSLTTVFTTNFLQQF